MVEINQNQCILAGESLQEINVNPAFLQREFINVRANEETRMRALFFAVAICHQTHTLYNSNTGATGWEYIEEVFLRLMKTDDPLLNPTYINSLNKEMLANSLRIEFSHSRLPEDTTLDRISERVELIKELSIFILENFNGSYAALLASTDKKLANTENGYYNILGQTRTFGDLHKKKSIFLYKLLHDSNLYQATDIQHTLPIMDYHMQRVLLRLGCVEIKDIALRKAILHRQKLSSDEPIRSACIDAIKIIARVSGHSILSMNDFFWPLGRSCCSETPVCQSGQCSKTPCSFSNLTTYPPHTRCIFQNFCTGAEDLNYSLLWEPIVDTHYY